MEMLALPYFANLAVPGAISCSPSEWLAGVSHYKERGVQKHRRCARVIARPIRDYPLATRAVRPAQH